MEQNTMSIHPFAALADLRHERAARRELTHELAAFTSDADRLELETIADRYSDEDSREIRQILFRLAA
jgi:hypothetical protein